jgi:hypothetical protein
VVTKSADQPKAVCGDGFHASARVLIARIAADWRAGRDTSKDIKTLVGLAREENQATLDRLAEAGLPGGIRIECLDGDERVRLRGGTSDGEFFCARRPRADTWIHSQCLDATIRWKERYRCVGHETVEDPEYGILQVMSLQEFVDEMEGSQE